MIGCLGVFARCAVPVFFSRSSFTFVRCLRQKDASSRASTLTRRPCLLPLPHPLPSLPSSCLALTRAHHGPDGSTQTLDKNLRTKIWNKNLRFFFAYSYRPFLRRPSRIPLCCPESSRGSPRANPRETPTRKSETQPAPTPPASQLKETPRHHPPIILFNMSPWRAKLEVHSQAPVSPPLWRGMRRTMRSRRS